MRDRMTTICSDSELLGQVLDGKLNICCSESYAELFTVAMKARSLFNDKIDVYGIQ